MDFVGKEVYGLLKVIGYAHFERGILMGKK
jgi:hypothetical protein